MENVPGVTFQKIYRYKNKEALADTIYYNFSDLIGNKQVKHTKDDIIELLSSENMIGVLAYEGRVIVGYLIGEITVIADGRMVLFITYIYTAKKYRRRGLASKMLSMMTEHGMDFGVRCIMLRTNLSVSRLAQFYDKHGFSIDNTMKDHNVGDNKILIKYLYY